MLAPTSSSSSSSSSSKHYQPSKTPTNRASRFPRACTTRRRPPPSPPPPDRRHTSRDREESNQTSRILTPLAPSPPSPSSASPSQVQRWELRSMWQFASLLNFLNVFRAVVNIGVEFSAEELETALIAPNGMLDDVHIPLLKVIPPTARMALGRATWVTVLCRKLKDWWHWVAEGEIPLVASHGAELEIYRTLDPATRVLILKALCDIRVVQEDIRSYIESSLKHSIPLSSFRKERIGCDSHGISYWYEDDPIIGHRLYREISQVELPKTKSKGPASSPRVTYHWETIATNLDAFQEISVS